MLGFYGIASLCVFIAVYLGGYAIDTLYGHSAKPQFFLPAALQFLPAVVLFSIGVYCDILATDLYMPSS